MKSKIIELLKSESKKYVSGETISKTLGVSRTAIWKHMKKLKEEGYVIESATQKGYRLVSEPKEITEIDLIKITKEIDSIQNVFFLDTIESTNTFAKEKAKDSNIHSAIVFSREQTMGRGRMGRTWYSEKDKGLWFSLLLRPSIPPHEIAKVTLLAAASVAKAIEEETSLNAEIKWPNDIVIKGKKVCGILTEMSVEIDAVHYLVVGIGINLLHENMEREIENKATSLYLTLGDKNVDPKKLLRSILFYFDDFYNQWEKNNDTEAFIKVNREKSALMGKKAYIYEKDVPMEVFVETIDSSGALIVYPIVDGVKSDSPKKVNSGEVSVRGLEGYL